RHRDLQRERAAVTRAGDVPGVDAHPRGAEPDRPDAFLKVQNQTRERFGADALQDAPVVELGGVAGDQVVARPPAGQQRRRRREIQRTGILRARLRKSKALSGKRRAGARAAPRNRAKSRAPCWYAGCCRSAAGGPMRSRRVSISIIALAGAIVGAQRLAAAATNFNVTNSGASAYVIDGVNNA